MGKKMERTQTKCYFGSHEHEEERVGVEQTGLVLNVFIHLYSRENTRSQKGVMEASRGDDQTSNPKKKRIPSLLHLVVKK